ncbi:MAG: 16S rRNA (cytosine(1402)-N(4))-methyltransferase RsmH [Fimbriimonadaceae bacterium]|nr:16S rRNA (cytosine(1402)-N(4))-methyltransferase RsmH [Fimbriimonadaceae bacterium]
MPVMLAEILAYLDPQPGQVMVDGTLGLGGHAREFAMRITPGGILFGFDWDEAMFVIAKDRLRDLTNVEIILTPQDFRSAPEVIDQYAKRVDGVLLDLGLNSGQVDDPQRGMSFREIGPLDMRMDQRVGEPASAWLNRATPDEIENVLFHYGDERWARAIAKVIVATRKDKPLKTTQDLVDCVLNAIPPKARDKRIHPATRTFQAVRIYLNRELEGLSDAIIALANRLNPCGNVAVLSYHSGEDRIVKNTFRDLSGEDFEERTKKPVLPGADEVARNARARSAKLRVLRRRPLVPPSQTEDPTALN